MGLKNSPPTFQKVMTDTLKNCGDFWPVYLDDIIDFSISFEEHLLHLKCVLAALQVKYLVLNLPKCVLATNQIDYLGHTISPKTITSKKEKNCCDSSNKRTSYFGATKAAPIHAVTNLTNNRHYKFKCFDAQSKAFHELKLFLLSASLFSRYPVDHVSLMLTTDASGWNR